MTAPAFARRATAAVVAVVMALAAAACSSSGGGPDRVAPRTTFVVALSEEPPGFNWNKSGNETTATNDIAQNLFFYASKSDPTSRLDYSGLAGPPTVISTGPQIIEWRIHPDATWSDGTPVTSEDLRYHYEVLKDPANDAAEREGYDRIKTFTVVDDKTVRVEFEPAYSEYPGLWSAVAQAAFLQSQPGGFNRALDDQPGPSAGPFQFDEWRKGESITLVPNPQWRGQKPGLDEIVFRFIEDPAAQVQALANGEVDMISPSPDLDLVRQLDELAASGDIRVTRGFGVQWDLLTLNLGNPILADRRVRQAIAHGVDRNAILDTVIRPIAPDARRLDNFVYMANQSNYEPHAAQYASPDLAAARRLLDEAGWVPGPGGIRQKDGTRLSLRISAITGFARFESAAELATGQLREVGIELLSDDCPSNCLLERAENGDFDILSAGWLGNVFPVSVITAIFSTSGAQNWGHFSNATFDDLVGRAASVADASEQAPLANQADTVLWEEVPGLALYQAPTVFAASNRFVGMADNPSGSGIFWNSHTWGPRP